MNTNLLRYFPSHIHPLTLVSDPDHLLAGEALMAELTRRGFQIIQEADPVLLRRRVDDCLLYTSDAADDLPRVDLGGRWIIKKKNKQHKHTSSYSNALDMYHYTL